MEERLFQVLCIGYDDGGDHVEYEFLVTHVSGRARKVRKRFSELLAAHEELTNKFTALPDFPPKGLPGLLLVMGSDFINRRVIGLQRWFEGLCVRRDVVSAVEFQRLLGVHAPVAISSIRGHKWLTPHAVDREGLRCVTATLELEVAIEELEGGGDVDILTATVQILVAGCNPGRPASKCAHGTAQSWTSRPGSQLVVSSLPCGEEVVIEVRARNALGAGSPSFLQLMVPGRRAIRLSQGMRVRAVWAGDGNWYDGILKTLCPNDFVVVTWLRPAPLSGEVLVCVCDTGGDDTMHRSVPRGLVSPVGHDWEEEEEQEGVAVAMTESYALEHATVGDHCSALVMKESARALEPNAGTARRKELDVGPIAREPHGEMAQNDSDFVPDEESSLPFVSGVPYPSAGGCQTASVDLKIDEIEVATPDGLMLFVLDVRLGDQRVERLEWHLDDNLAEKVKAFVHSCQLKMIFEESLLTQVELMVHIGKRHNAVDIVDLV